MKERGSDYDSVARLITASRFGRKVDRDRTARILRVVSVLESHGFITEVDAEKLVSKTVAKLAVSTIPSPAYRGYVFKAAYSKSLSELSVKRILNRAH